MGNFKQSLYPIFLIFIILFLGCTPTRDEVNIHYLGHSSFIIAFNRDITILCDYGNENAYVEWGWDSPIYDAGEAGPDIITYSHHHADHFDEKRAEKFDAIRIAGSVDTTIKGVNITSYASSEKDIITYDNYSYLFTYKDFRVLHLGDCQADIMMVNDPAHAWVLEQRYPKGCDIVIMPIESTQKFILQAINMVKLLEPRVLIPSHYWSMDYKQEFLDKLHTSFSAENNKMMIYGRKGATYTYSKNKNTSELTVLDLVPNAR